MPPDKTSLSQNRDTACRIIRELRTNGEEAFLVGGCVRDLLLGEEPLDYDVATSARPEAVQRIFPKTVAVGARFGVILVVENGIEVEVATYRTEGVYSDGRRPDTVTYATAREDVAPTSARAPSPTATSAASTILTALARCGRYRSGRCTGIWWTSSASTRTSMRARAVTISRSSW